MLWQYRTELFEFTKDGLLGDKYVDDEEMEKTLNQLGSQEWELVTVTMLQDGVLAFLKRGAQGKRSEVETPPSRTVEPAEPSSPVIQPRPPVSARTTVAATDKLRKGEEEEEREPFRGLERQRRTAPQKDDTDLIGGIRIS